MPNGSVYKRNLRVRLSEAQNHRCCFCGILMVVDLNPRLKPPINYATIEHFYSKREYEAGLATGISSFNSVMNKIASCWLCNNQRGDMDAMEFYEIKQQAKNGVDPIHIRQKLKNIQRTTRGMKVGQKGLYTMLRNMSKHCPTCVYSGGKCVANDNEETNMKVQEDFDVEEAREWYKKGWKDANDFRQDRSYYPNHWGAVAYGLVLYGMMILAAGIAAFYPAFIAIGGVMTVLSIPAFMRNKKVLNRHNEEMKAKWGDAWSK